jgi:hypothetical protein
VACINDFFLSMSFSCLSLPCVFLLAAAAPPLLAAPHDTKVSDHTATTTTQQRQPLPFSPFPLYIPMAQNNPHHQPAPHHFNYSSNQTDTRTNEGTPVIVLPSVRVQGLSSLRSVSSASTSASASLMYGCVTCALVGGWMCGEGVDDRLISWLAGF